MLSDEERKAINQLKADTSFYDYELKNGNYIYELFKIEVYKKDIDVILNLIKKQSKEMEEYKKQLDLDYVDKHFVPIERYNQLEKEIEELNKSDASKEQSSMDYYNLYKELVDKIKAKIEEQDKIINTGGIDFNTKSYARCKKEVLQSLLEKE